MGYVVLHFNKAKGNEARMTKHIERSVDPPNVDKSRTHLNRELIEFPSGVTNRTQAIQHRIKTAGIKRKITSDQVRVWISYLCLDKKLSDKKFNFIL